MASMSTLTRQSLILGPFGISLLALLLGSVSACSEPDPEEERVDPSACRISGEAETQRQLKLTRVLTGATVPSPVQMGPAPDGTKRVFLLSQPGRIFVADSVTETGGAAVWLDITTGKNLEAGGEKGLLGLAFAPDFLSSGRFYLNYTRRQAGQLQTVISRFTVNPPLTGMPSPASEQILLTIDQPYDNHNGGGLAFGPDGFLYIGMGDGGSAGDPQNYSQNMNSLLGKMLRIDVNTTGATYRVPPDNPFVGQAGRRAEIWASGLRNPWRFAFDPDPSPNGTLWAADVGQNAVEEIDVIEKGRNYGWKIMEGDRCYSPATNCDRTGLTLPVYAYPQTEGRSVTGGFVYRGRAMPHLVGHYLFTDYVSGVLWGLQKMADGLYVRSTLLETGKEIPAFGVDADGELYIFDYRTAHLFRIEPGSTVAGGGAVLPALLSQTGCFSDLATRKLARGVISYGVNAPLWSDGTEKERGLSLPPGEKVRYGDSGAWSLPVGSVLIKTFLDGVRPLETRFLMRGSDRWRGVTYRWRADGTDAELLTMGLTESVGSRTWTYPSRTECLVCHTEAAGEVLGIQTGQLNRTHDLYGSGRTHNQIDLLARLGIVEGVPGEAGSLLRFPDPGDQAAPLGVRARAYLAANCAHCHQPGGVAVGTTDLRFGTKLADTKACGAAPLQGDLGVVGARILQPGDPDKSTLLLRMVTTNPSERMPTVASAVPDAAGIALIRAWIAGLPQTCVDPDLP
jgi:uncharacterized repeat protein (TIGR03806 family)